jgi:hypothetical protein
MSYDIYIVSANGDDVLFREKHTINGGTYEVGGTNDAHLNVTFNYAPIFKEVLDPELGIKILNDMDINESLQLLDDANRSLSGTPDNDYWKCTEGNVKKVIQDLIKMAEMAMYEFPEIEMKWKILY